MTETRSGDELLYSRLDAAIKEYRGDPGALIQILHRAQEIWGYLPEDVLRHISGKMKIPISQIYGVVTFYSFFSMVPKGKHTIMVCMGTACYVKGAERLIDRFERELGIELGQTTTDNLFTLTAVRCLGACGLAPVMVVDDDIYGKMAPDEAVKVLKKYS